MRITPLIVVRRSLSRIAAGPVEDYAKHALSRKLLEQAMDHAVSSLARPHHQQCSVGPIYQDRCVSEDPKRRCIDDDVVEHLVDFVEDSAKSGTGKKLSAVVANRAARQQVETGRLQPYYRFLKRHLSG